MESTKQIFFDLSIKIAIGIFYYLALYANALNYGLEYKPINEEVYLTPLSSYNYFSNCCFISSFCLTVSCIFFKHKHLDDFICAVIYFTCLITSAVKMNDSYLNNMTWGWFDSLDLGIQYVTATALALILGVRTCQLMQYCLSFMVRRYYG